MESSQFHWKVPVFHCKAPVFDREAPVFDCEAPVFDREAPVFDRKPPVFDRKPPVFDRRHDEPAAAALRPRPVQLELRGVCDESLELDHASPPQGRRRGRIRERVRRTGRTWLKAREPAG